MKFCENFTFWCKILVKIIPFFAAACALELLPETDRSKADDAGVVMMTKSVNTTYHRILADSSSAALPEPWTLYRETLACPAERMQAGLLTISMTNEHGQSFEDSIAVTFNENFEEVLKWAALLPFVGAVALIAIASMMQHGSQLPI